MNTCGVAYRTMYRNEEASAFLPLSRERAADASARKPTGFVVGSVVEVSVLLYRADVCHVRGAGGGHGGGAGPPHGVRDAAGWRVVAGVASLAGALVFHPRPL